MLIKLNVDNLSKIHRAVFELQFPKVVIKGVLAAHTVTLITYCVMKMITTFSLKVGQFLPDAVIVASSDKECMHKCRCRWL